jgi:uncharacterized protein (TIGR02569 family)
LTDFKGFAPHNLPEIHERINNMTQPASDVLEAFGISTRPVPVAGGRNLCFKAGDIILKPSDDDQEAEYVGSLCHSIAALQPTNYYVPEPITSQLGYVYKGWTAWTFLPGKSEPNLEAILEACRGFHADTATLSTEKPEFLKQRLDRFTEADSVTWEEKTLDEVADVNTEILSIIQPALDQLLKLRKPILADLKNQLIHGDLTGNILFDADTNVPPGIIDITLYWRPALYAEAIIVADGLAWLGKGAELIEAFGTDEVRLQLLVRALYWRLLSYAIDPDLVFVGWHLPRVDYGRCAAIVGGFLEG